MAVRLVAVERAAGVLKLPHEAAIERVQRGLGLALGLSLLASKHGDLERACEDIVEALRELAPELTAMGLTFTSFTS